jgi:hypothetical protein
MIKMTVRVALLLPICFACTSNTDRGKSSDSVPAAASTANATNPKAKPINASVEPTRLATLPISAYHTTLAIDQDTVYLLSSHAAFRLIPGQLPQGIKLELGIGPTVTHSGFVYWSSGYIWRAPKSGGDPEKIAKFPHQPQYFVSSGDALAWIDLTDAGLFTIQTLANNKPRVLVSSNQELSDLNLIQDTVYFVDRPTDATWRIGRVKVDGGEPSYGPERSGSRPSMLVGTDEIYYYDINASEIRRLSRDGITEEALLKKFVCSPIHVSNEIYCGCVEGLFEVTKDTYQPRILSHNRPGQITNITSDSKRVVWTVDVGRDNLAVDMLPVSSQGLTNH